jgi:hypothetical protein
MWAAKRISQTLILAVLLLCFSILAFEMDGSSAAAAVPEAVSSPGFLGGSTEGIVSANYSYLTGGSASSLGHPVQYQFDWKGDGSDLSPWGPATQSKVWNVAGIYKVRSRARCTQDNAVVSRWSTEISVTIGSCFYALIPTSNTFGPAAGSASVSITAHPDCSWKASTNPGSWDWIGIASGASGAGNGTVSYFVLANTTGSTRTGTLTIAGQTFTITQAGK